MCLLPHVAHATAQMVMKQLLTRSPEVTAISQNDPGASDSTAAAEQPTSGGGNAKKQLVTAAGNTLFKALTTAHSVMESLISIDTETATLTSVKAIILSSWYHALLLC